MTGPIARVLAASLSVAAGCAEAQPRASPAAAPASVQPQYTRDLSDREISEAISSELRADGGVAEAILVAVSDGIVELAGPVPHLEAKERATLVAQSVRGVRSVSNRLTVYAPRRPDAELQRNVQEALAYDASTSDLRVDVLVADGRVQLSGTVRSAADSSAAEQVAQAILGVREVQSDLRIAEQPGRSDAAVRQDVESVLRWDSLVDETALRISVRQGAVHIAGTVGSAAERERAARLARVDGASHVDVSSVDVRWSPRRDRRDPDALDVSDREVADALWAVMMRDPRVRSYNVTCDVKKGVVTLNGEVDNVRAKLAAEANARNTLGVIEIDSRLTVQRVPDIPDDTLRRKVSVALKLNSMTSPYHIEVDAQSGVVTLEGVVGTHFERARAEDLAGRTRGVVRVENQLRVLRPAFAYVYNENMAPDEPLIPSGNSLTAIARSDDEIRANIERELLWSPFVDASRVTVTVVNGRATLTGTVSRYADIRAATENAFEGGAALVDNQLRIRQ